MQLTLESLRYMIWLQWFGAAIALSIALWGTSSKAYLLVVSFILTAGVLTLVSRGLRKEQVWVAVLFMAFCVLDFFNAISDGLSIVSTVDLLGAVLSFVAFCGLVNWFRERSAANKPKSNQVVKNARSIG